MSYVSNRPLGKRPQISSPFLVVPLYAALFFAVCWSSYRVMYENQHTLEGKMLSANLTTFEKRVPRRGLISTIEPFTDKHPNDATIWLADLWDRETPETKRTLIVQWVRIWQEIVKTRPADNSPSHLWIKAPDGSYIESKVSKAR